MDRTILPSKFTSIRRQKLFLLLVAATLSAATLVACSREPRLPATTDVTEATVNPLGDGIKTAQEGRKLFLQNCAICHGHLGQGDGPSRSTLIAEPANLTIDPVASYTDGRIFLAIRLGKMVGGRLTMPPIEKMSDEQIWKTISFLRTIRQGPVSVAQSRP